MKKFSKKLLSVLLAVMMMLPVIQLGSVFSSAYSYRTTAPEKTNAYYYSNNNPYYASGYGIPNCTCYAWGRAYEILGTKPNLPVRNAGDWYGYNRSNGYYQYGTTPKAGSIVCWSGHVAFVEDVNSDGTIKMSESNWSGRTNPAKAFRYFNSVNPKTYTSGFQGYIYVCPTGTTPGVKKFTPRFSAPAKSGYYSIYTRNNCCMYAKCRASEILQKENFNIGSNGPGGYFDYLKNIFPNGTMPKPGALAISTGHIAVVESVSGNTITLSEGSYRYQAKNSGSYSNVVVDGGGTMGPADATGTWYDNRTITYNTSTGKPDTNFSGTWKGYIYLVADDGTVNEPGIIDGPAGGNHYDPNAIKQIGTYSVNSNTNLRTSYGTQNGIVCLVTKGSQIYVSETNGNWGKITYAGKTGWLCLDYSSFLSVPEATTPNVSISTNRIAQGSNITISYSSSNAAKYHVYQNGTEVYSGTSTSYLANLANAGTYSFYVAAENSAGKRTGNSSTVTCEAMAPSTVQFVDFDGSLLSEQSVPYGSSAVAPAAPERKGYNFNGWDKAYSNITADTTVNATYTKKVYTVNFYGQKLLETSEPELLKSQKVEFESDATPPTDTKPFAGYSFIGWNSDRYNNVYTDSADQTINIYGVYEWDNYDLPIILSNVHATREKDEDGYRVTFTIQNYNVGTTKGRAIITLKTSEGKLISTTESASFKLGKAATKSFDEFVDCENVATVVEVVITNGLSTGVPISENVTANVDTSEMWSDWNDELPANTNNLEIESRTLYRSRTKETKTHTSKTLDGWVYDGEASSRTVNGSSFTPISPVFTDELVRYVSDPVRVVTGYNQKTQYRYHHYASNNAATCWPYWTSGTPNLHYYGWNDSPSEYYTTKYYSADGCNHNIYREGGHNMWCNSCNSRNCCWYDQETRTVDNPNSPIYGNRYDYTEIYYTYNFYRWLDWSNWGETSVAASSNVEVEQKTQYRWFTNALSLEDNSGVTRTVSSDTYGKMADCAGKQLTLFVYKYDEASDFTDEFVGQTTIAADGSYSFSFKLREEPSIKSGDYTIALGVEGTTELQIIDTIEAPKPVYTVNFYDANGNIISTQLITEGENAIVPELPEKTGYRFIYWNLDNLNLENDPALSSPANVTNIRSDMDIYPAYEREEYTVVFVDWLQQTVEAQTYKAGEIIIAPEVDAVAGYNFDGWDALNGGTVNAETDMIITAEYSKKTYTIKFVDIDGRTIVSEQQVEYDDSAYIPQYDFDDSVVLYGFLNSDEFVNVDHDAIIYPTYYFDETVAEPIANYETGEYDAAIDLVLTAEDANAVIYYSIDGSEDEMEYTGPIHIDRTCSVSFHAESLGKNNSETVTNYYCINSGDTPTSWMTYSQIPDAVKNNLSSYTLESDDGYRYKDTQATSSFSTYNSLLGSGWADLSEQTVYTAWQDAELTPDASLINCTVETQEVDDTSVYRYQYSHYKYTDNGVVCYAPNEADGFDCEYETVIVDSRLSAAGFLDNGTTYYNYNGETWFNQTKIFGVKTQYRLAYVEKTVYKWTAWDIIAPASGETRVYENETVYRFYNKEYHIIKIWENDYDFKAQFVEDEHTVVIADVNDIYGYNFVGLFTDNEFTNAWNTATPVTESMDLYVSYTPKQYTVTFQMQDGTEIDSQLVDYLECAVAPETDSIPGWVFAGWDKPFDRITEDTVITGKYVRESEYARISLNQTKAMLYVGNFAQLTATISPANLTNEEIFWSSSDLNVATVNETGKITAVGEGTAVISAVAVSSGETARCEVTVSADYSTRIILSTLAKIGMDSERNVRVAPSNAMTVADIKEATSANAIYDGNGYELEDSDIAMTVGSLKAQFVNEELKVYGTDGTELYDTDIVTTGSVIKLQYNGSDLDSVTVVFTGDFDCDGLISNRDVVMIAQYVLESRTADRYQLIAIDCNGDGAVNNKDCAMLARYLVGKESL